ncbi:hypothetical protein C7459_103199 [Tumebacillus permanentifrigoris]|uniref:Uncharacterized protein n=1 Tax=Tumebacillus permanentifrigoris TaxID=378543 RepID=A0A316DEQ0_9BACL|nr:hypothetical protein C7459_103199 [Tumebacillus permanentifrigoris]
MRMNMNDPDFFIAVSGLEVVGVFFILIALFEIFQKAKR